MAERLQGKHDIVWNVMVEQKLHGVPAAVWRATSTSIFTPMILVIGKALVDLGTGDRGKALSNNAIHRLTTLE